MPTENVEASCLCGHVRLQADLPPLRVGHCHCENCRRAQGAGVWTWAAFASDRVRVLSGEADLASYVSDTEATRRFCRVCGSTLTYESPRWPNLIDLSVANLDGPLGTAPSRHNYADRSPDWCPILDDLPRLGGATGQERIATS